MNQGEGFDSPLRPPKMKQYIIIRNDKRIPIGKIIAHVGHNTLNAFIFGTFNDRMSIEQSSWYMDYDQKKIVVTASLSEIKKIINLANSESIPTAMINDVNYKYPICAVVGPVNDEKSYHLGLADLPLYKG